MRLASNKYVVGGLRKLQHIMVVGRPYSRLGYAIQSYKGKMLPREADHSIFVIDQKEALITHKNFLSGEEHLPR